MSKQPLRPGLISNSLSVPAFANLWTFAFSSTLSTPFVSRSLYSGTTPSASKTTVNSDNASKCNRTFSKCKSKKEPGPCLVQSKRQTRRLRTIYASIQTFGMIASGWKLRGAAMELLESHGDARGTLWLGYGVGDRPAMNTTKRKVRGLGVRRREVKMVPPCFGIISLLFA